MSPPLESPASSSFPRVGLTAIGVAAIRAAESTRPDRLFDDPYAAGFARSGWRLAPRIDRPADGGRGAEAARADFVDHRADPLSR